MDVGSGTGLGPNPWSVDDEKRFPVQKNSSYRVSGVISLNIAVFN